MMHLASPDDLAKLLPMVAAFHGERGQEGDEAQRQAALGPLLDGSPHGAVWLIGPRKAPVGYVAVTFGWSIAEGGLEGTVEELFIRPAVRRRGMGSEALSDIAKALKANGVRTLHLEVDRSDETVQRFCARARFGARDGQLRMSRVL